MFLQLTSSFAALFRISVCVLLCYTFSSMGYATTSQFHYSFFFFILHSGHRISLLFCSNTLPSIASLLPHSCHFFSPCFFFSPVSCFLAKVTLYIFHLFLKKKLLSLVFIGLNPLAFVSSTVHIGCHHLLHDLSSLKQEYTFWRYTLLITVLLYLFPYKIYWFFFLLHLLQLDCICYLLFSPLLLSFCYQILLLKVPYFPIFKTLHFFYFLPLYFHFLSYPISHHSTCQYFKLTVGNQCSLSLLFLVPAVTGQVSKPSMAKTLFFFSFLQFCPQFGKGIPLLEYVTHEVIVLCQRYSVLSLEICYKITFKKKTISYTFINLIRNVMRALRRNKFPTHSRYK